MWGTHFTPEGATEMPVKSLSPGLNVDPPQSQASVQISVAIMTLMQTGATVKQGNEVNGVLHNGFMTP